MLEHGTKLGRYEIRSKLGAGGMGEVYLAHDEALDRKVALKILPADLAAKTDRMERFVREAKAAAALNHPNIAHIYEIGESEGVNFIAMEFVDGDTLRQLIHGKPANLKKLLRYLQHTAEALSKAHATGIVHRDLKPDNIMVTREGHAKILDFGLAKLIEPQLADPSKASEEEQITAIMQQHSTPGVIMGTVGYMSPEQARGDVRDIDHRSDIFSFGCILFEAATKHKPFMGDSMVKSLHKIIYEPAPPLTDFNPTAPADLQRIVRRCLAKDPEDRYQTIKDVAIELREFRRDLEAGAASSQTPASPSGNVVADTTPMVSQPSASSLELQTAIRSSAPSIADVPVSQTALSGLSLAEGSRRTRIIMFAAAAVVGLVGMSIVGFMLLRGNRPPPFTRIRATPVTSSGKAFSAAISPDGRYIVHVESDAGRQSIELRQVATNTNQQIVPPAEANYSALTFSPDGNYLYYVMRDQANPSSALFRKPVLGGEAAKLTTNLFSGASPSPDGKRFVFSRIDTARNEASIVVANVDGSGEQTIATHKIPDIFLDVAWSPDNQTLAVATNSLKGSAHGAIITVPVSGGAEKILTRQSWYQADRVRWLGDSSGLMVSAIEQSFGPHQLWYVSYPGGEARQITNDLNDYTSVSVTADSSSLVTVQREVNFSMWVAPMNGNALSAPPPNTFPIERDPFRQITSVGRKRDGYSGIAWTPDGRITYTSAAAGTYDIWVMQPDGSGQRQLTTAAPGVISHTNGFQSISPDGRYIFFSSDRVTGSPHIWRMDASGGNLKQLTNGAGENFAQVTPDGQSVIYIDFANIAIAKVSIDGGQPTQLSDRAGGRPTISPDGKLIAFGLKVDQNAPAKIALMPSSGGAPIKLLDVPVTADLLSLTWTPDSRALAYVDTRGGISNLWSVPIDGGASAQLTDFRADRMSCFDFSRDGKWVAISRGNSSNDVVLFSNVK